jgi:hypothetical protein
MQHEAAAVDSAWALSGVLHSSSAEIDRFIMFAIVVLVVLLAAQVSAFAPMGRSFAVRVSRASNMLRTPQMSMSDDDQSTWKVDEDTSELECESFSSLQRRKAMEEAARYAAEAAAEAAAAAAAAEAAKKAEEEAGKAKKEEAKPVAAPSSAVVSAPPKGSSLTPEGEKRSGFDVGLLIAFPLMIGTLALFLFFPIIAPQLAGTLPPAGTP